MNDNLFGRIAYIEITNRVTKEKITITDNLRFEFEYFKSVDESESTSLGEIKIYGLTQETYKSLGDRHESIVELFCGYRDSNINPVNKLFTADLSYKSWEIAEGTTITTLSVNGNFNILFTGDKISKGFPKGITFIEILQDIANDLTGGRFEGKLINTPEINETEATAIAEQIQVTRLPFGTSIVGTPKQALDRFSKMFYFEYYIDESENKLHINFDPLKAKQTYLKSYYENKSSTDSELSQRRSIATALNTLNNPDGSSKLKFDIGINNDQALVLTTETGLVGSPKLTYKTATKNYDEALRGDEEIQKRKEQKIRRKKDGSAIIDDKTGKAKLTKKPKTYTVTRKQVNCTAFINAAVQPQSLVKIETRDNFYDGNFNGVYRVRDVKFKGDTHGNAWYMELELNE